MPSGFELANLLAQLGVGRNPEWSPQSTLGVYDYVGAPASESVGVPVTNSVVALVLVGLRAEIHRRRADVTMTVLDVGATYTVTINGTAMNKATPADEDALIIGLRDAILADAIVGGAAGANQVVTAIALDAAGATTTGTGAGGNAAVTLVVWGTVEADFQIDISATGTGVLACEAEGNSATMRVYGLPDTDTVASGQTAPSGWRLVNGAGAITLDWRGFFDRFETSGLSQIYIELESLDGPGADGATVTYRPGGGLHVGPCVQE